jgi:hypothetical protein
MKKFLKIILVSLPVLIIVIVLAIFSVRLPIWSKCGGTGWSGNKPDCSCIGLKLQEGFPWGQIKCVGIRTLCYARPPRSEINSAMMQMGNYQNITAGDVRNFLEANYKNYPYTGYFKVGKQKIETSQVCTGVGGGGESCKDVNDTQFEYKIGVDCAYYDKNQ